MAFPVLEFGALSYGSSTLFSNEQNTNGFIRINADYVSGSPNVTNIAAVAGFFGINEIKPGMVMVSSGEISGETTVVSVDVGNNSLVMADNAIASATGQLTRIRPQKGLYFFESASFSKTGTGEPSDLRDITGSNDSEYDATTPKWGIIAPLAKTGSATTTVIGEYGQYVITDIQSRISTTQMNFFASASADIGDSFIEGSGSQVSAGASNLIVAEISTTNGLMPIMSSGDVGAGSQGLALAAYNASVASVFAALGSGSGFPFTGSAAISGSIDMTGSFTTLLNTSENFLIKNAAATTQSLFQINNEGVAVFRARVGSDGTPSPVVGGLYFTTSSAFIGVD